MAKARLDGLLSALIAKLPAERTPWQRDERIAWLWMMALAFDVIYGPCGGISIAPEEKAARPANAATASGIGGSDLGEAPPGESAKRFYVDRDGFAMADGRPIGMEDLPPNAILWDERTGIECGDVQAILWRDIGSTRRGVPAGVVLRPTTETT